MTKETQAVLKLDEKDFDKLMEAIELLPKAAALIVAHHAGLIPLKGPGLKRILALLLLRV